MFVAGAFGSAIALGGPAAAEPPVALKLEGEDLVATFSGRPLLTYRRKTVPAPAGMNPLLASSGYIHPFYAPDGAIVTDEFCPDHPHQRGVFAAWTKTKLTLGGETLEPDFWNIHTGKGRTRSLGVEILPPAKGEPGFRSKQVYEAKRGEAWEPVLDETWEVRFPTQPAASPELPAAAYLFDIVVRQTPRVAIELPKYLYGGFAVRGARQWGKGSDLVVLTSEGKDRTAADASRPRWIDLSGSVDGRRVGVTLMEHAGNLRAPNGVRMHPEMPYTVFALPQSGPVTLEAGRPVAFRYRVVAHNGGANVELLNRLWAELPK